MEEYLTKIVTGFAVELTKLCMEIIKDNIKKQNNTEKPEKTKD